MTEYNLDSIWSAMSEFRHRSEKEGEFNLKRSRQNEEWVWTMVEDRLRSKLEENQAVHQMLPSLLQNVRNGQTIPAIAADTIWDTFEDSMNKQNSKPSS